MNVILFSEDSPVIAVELIDQTMVEGDTAFFTCQATGTPIPNISWYFNGAPVDTVNTIKYMISEMEFNPITKNSTLTIMNLELSDIGTYSCNATNFVSGITSSGILSVEGEDIPEIHKDCTLFISQCICFSMSIVWLLENEASFANTELLQCPIQYMCCKAFYLSCLSIF